MAATAALAPFAVAGPPPATAAAAASKAVEKAADGKYIVGLAAAPVATYAGGVAGLAATSSSDGVTFNRAAPAVGAYRAYLDDQREAVLDAVPGVTPFYEYDWAISGFAASMSYEEAQTVAAQPGVRAVTPNEMLELTTTHSPTFLGLDQPGGAWETAGGADVLGGAGEDVVIGIIDGGFTPESGSFAPLDPAPATTVPDGWLGTCDTGDASDLGGGPVGDVTTDGDQPAELACEGTVYNSKVIGAHYFVEGFGAPDPDEFLSARDAGGHGSHTGSTAGGNHGVPITVAGEELGEISGMAPRARISVYKVCWQTITGGSCSSADSTAAIEMATIDGVDVINYSISGSLTSAIDPVALAFYGAAATGIFVAVSAGNAGTPGSVAHNYPWVTTVAASTQDRRFDVTVTLGNGDTYSGTGISGGVAESDAVFGGDIPSEPGAQSALCALGSLDPDEAEGKIVVCNRGTVSRVVKSQAVLEAGGIGMVLANDAPNGASTATERHSVPTAHVSFLDGVAIIDYIRSKNDPTITLSSYDLIIGDELTAPSMASFSSRGPGGVADGDLLKPDITAPGVDILATLAPYAGAYGELYGFQSGTSMSSPHIAGLGALLRDIHPDWSPMAIKSALMTGAYQSNNQGEPIERLGEVATPFEFGAGHVDTQASAATPLVYESTLLEWSQFLCGTELQSDPACELLDPIDPSELNLASIAVSDLTGYSDVTRTVTNRSADAVTATASAESPDGFDVTVTPEEIALGPGESATFVVHVEIGAAPLDEWRFGSYTWTTDSSVEVRSPLAVKADSFDAAELLEGSGSTGEVTDITGAGITADIQVQVSGLDAAQVDSAVLSEPTSGAFATGAPPDPADLEPHLMAAVLDIPADTDLAHFELFAEDYALTSDLDLYVYSGVWPDVELAESSTSPVAAEMVALDSPEEGPYLVYVDLWALEPGVLSETVYLHSFVVGEDGDGNFTVTPDSYSVEPGDMTPITFSWEGLAGPEDMSTAVVSPLVSRYLGLADYVDGEGNDLARTLVRVDVEAEAPPTTPPTTVPPTTEPPTTPPPTDPPTSDPPTPVPSTTLPNTGGGDTPMFVALGLGAVLLGGAFVALAARRLRLG